MLTSLLALATTCTTFEDNPMANAPTAVGLEAEVVQQKKWWNKPIRESAVLRKY